MPKYASQTTVSSERSRAEIETVLARYGASHFMYGTSPDRAMVAFQANSRRVKFELPMPDPHAHEFKFVKHARRYAETQRSDLQRIAAWEQACRQRWRALLLVIKAKLEAVDAGITTFEEEFLAHLVLPNGQTVGAAFIPQLNDAYDSGRMPTLSIGFDG